MNANLEWHKANLASCGLKNAKWNVWNILIINLIQFILLRFFVYKMISSSDYHIILFKTFTFHFIFGIYFKSEIIIFKYLIQFQSSHANTTFELLCLYFARKNMQYFFWRSCCAVCFYHCFTNYTKILTNQWLVTTNKEKKSNIRRKKSLPVSYAGLIHYLPTFYCFTNFYHYISIRPKIYLL